MSLLGKIFAFLNLLGVSAVLVLGMMTYNKKIAWANAGAQQELRLKGLPIDDQEVDRYGYVRVENLNEGNIKAVVPGSPLVKSQVEEVNRVHNIITGQLAERATPEDKLLHLARVLKPFTSDYVRYAELVAIDRRLGGLTPGDNNAAKKSQADLKSQLSQAARQAETLLKAPAMDEPRTNRDFSHAFREYAGIQREAASDPFVRAYLAVRDAALKDGKPIDFESLFAASIVYLQDEAQAELDALHKAASTGEIVCKVPDEPRMRKCSPGIQRHYIVRYLYNMTRFADPEGSKSSGWSSPAIERVVGVVGLEYFPAAVIEQAVRLGALSNTLQVTSNLPNTTTAEVVKQIERERTQFVAEHNQMITYLKELSSVVKERESRLGRAKKIADDQAALAADSKKINDDLNDMLGTTKDKAAREIAIIRELSKALLAVRLKARDAAEINQTLEQEIRRLERLYR